MSGDVLQGFLPFSGYARFFVTLSAVLAGSALFGEQLLVLVGASMPAFRVGGGLLLAALAIQTMAEGLRQLFPGLSWALDRAGLRFSPDRRW